jgi:hypothetical protein
MTEAEFRLAPHRARPLAHVSGRVKLISGFGEVGRRKIAELQDVIDLAAGIEGCDRLGADDLTAACRLRTYGT